MSTKLEQLKAFRTYAKDNTIKEIAKFVNDALDGPTFDALRLALPKRGRPVRNLSKWFAGQTRAGILKLVDRAIGMTKREIAKIGKAAGTDANGSPVNGSTLGQTYYPPESTVNETVQTA